ncbi:MAG: cysteine--tRNA ligase [Bacilli bacterium]|nr:cysteine--tRNA ligase [Bacilli bacterium]MBQ6404587.1 cysteine--tRNA ligase [Bacilli bacterium]
MKIYNTLSKKIEEFVPNVEGQVKMYTCGPTVYHYAHIGNLRTYIFEDVLEKGLKYLGYDVKRAMNITDVGHLTSDADTGEDKMLKGAQREGKTVYEIAEFYTEAFLNDMKDLNIKIPETIEKASDNIDVYIEMIEKMLADDYAYISNGNVYFDISKAKDYYQLSGKNPEDLMIGVRDTVEEDKAKRNPADFVLWFTLSKFENQAMKWDSPWGVGYPGWHIECSGINYKVFGEYLDIHCGGVDNIFPHHTNEIAQSEAFVGHKWCNYWCHGAYLNDETGKMSKSKGEFLTVSLLKSKGYSPIDYRFFCLNSHYRNPLTFTFESLDGARKALKRLKSKTLALKDEGNLDNESFTKYDELYKEALSNDLNTSSMITILYDVLKDESLNDKTKLELVKSFDKVLSLDLLKEEESVIDTDLEKMIQEKIVERKEAKKNKDFATADKIRDELLEQGIKLIDTREGTTYELI